jgi:inner membrane protein
MQIFAHTGLTLGTAVLLAGSIRELNRLRQTPDSGEKLPEKHKTQKVPWVKSLAVYADLRVLLAGSLLPDLIDKPIGHIFLQNMFHNNGRLFGHTFLFLFAVMILGIIIYKQKGMTFALVLAFGTFTHHVLDEMWINPHTLFWPALGFSFPMIEPPELNSAWAYISEWMGLFVLLWFTWTLLSRKSIPGFVLHGKV